MRFVRVQSRRYSFEGLPMTIEKRAECALDAGSSTEEVARIARFNIAARHRSAKAASAQRCTEGQMADRRG